MGREASIHANIESALRNNPHLLDRFGRPVIEGAQYTYTVALPQIYTVEKIAPVLDRQDLPPGMFRVQMVSRITVIVGNGMPVEELALCYMPPPAPEPPAPTTDAPAGIVLTDSPDSPDSSPASSEVPTDGPHTQD